jgi:hypothetical protein
MFTFLPLLIFAQEWMTMPTAAIPLIQSQPSGTAGGQTK